MGEAPSIPILEISWYRHPDTLVLKQMHVSARSHLISFRPVSSAVTAFLACPCFLLLPSLFNVIQNLVRLLHLHELFLCLQHLSVGKIRTHLIRMIPHREPLIRRPNLRVRRIHPDPQRPPRRPLPLEIKCLFQVLPARVAAAIIAEPCPIELLLPKSRTVGVPDRLAEVHPATAGEGDGSVVVGRQDEEGGEDGAREEVSSDPRAGRRRRRRSPRACCCCCCVRNI
mmetsp:Transcript_9681/g.14640  ORF Transcript_9681/g.14640 Transcript_9681/m.14640 type:complete len:227 (+) Transcript_9681:295-975(+)